VFPLVQNHQNRSTDRRHHAVTVENQKMARDVHKTKYYCMHTAWPTQPPIPPGSVNEDHLRPGRKWQVWLIPWEDERAVCRWNCEIPSERMPYLSGTPLRCVHDQAL